ncbi:MAG: bifunctional phosphopantothenoylcysteine decarboxylase/phosphopantothenate--cysteine ligase CoaBC [Culturomica sp.]|jgi:phosphopantothenoylcysteine decarboxylase/phosphopantothenate--cysteine ligase|nr:bifunctional phosphopantothenoylcysteine decarboxylase/phosphopantothenate--cysteine ligase CoaBC [Culturomica sp.]
MLKGKNILLGITGSIAAYKAAILVRLLIKEGANVKVVMTPLAKEFITPLTLAVLSKHPIMVDFYNPENGDWNSHVSAGIWADLYLIAPATANTIGKMANGIADNLLLTTYLSAKCPIMIAPAMDLDMYKHVAVQQNIQTLRSHGNIVLEATDGELASGLSGKGRMPEPEAILEQVRIFFADKQELKGRKVLITAGPTYEKIDDVRFIGNFSSGKMGFALAEKFRDRGADVTLISGPVNLDTPIGVERINVTSADEMYKIVTEKASDYDIIVSCAAVADFAPERQVEGKLKRGNDGLILKLKSTKDIAAELGRNKKTSQILVGFALEAENEMDNAQKKLESKGLDMIVLNSIQDEGACFGTDTNKITIIEKGGKISAYPLKNKTSVAEDIVNKIIEKI